MSVNIMSRLTFMKKMVKSDLDISIIYILPDRPTEQVKVFFNVI